MLTFKQGKKKLKLPAFKHVCCASERLTYPLYAVLVSDVDLYKNERPTREKITVLLNGQQARVEY